MNAQEENVEQSAVRAAAVRFEGVGKRFGDFVALASLSLEIAAGEFMVLVGPSGSGKTTALRILAGLESLSEGHVWIGGRCADMVAPRDRDVAMVFQDYALYPQMTVFDNLAFGLKMRKMSRPEIQARVQHAAAMLDLHPLLKRKPGQLSGGQKQRVALGRALVRAPQAFLMDEPLSNLDAQLRAQTRGEIKRLQQELGITTVYVTHDQVEAMTMGDRIALLHEGRLQQVATPSTVYESPENLFVAKFIGSPTMSDLALGATSRTGTTTLARGDLGIEIAGCPPLPEDVTIGIRPEHVRLWGTRPDLVGPLAGIVEFTEVLGRETFIGVRVADEVSITACVDGRSDLSLGDRTELGLMRGWLYAFDDAGRSVCRF